MSGVADSSHGGHASGDGATAQLLARRERLIERFALLQSELGGLLYEMAIRDHLELDVLGRRAAAMQRVDLELREIQAQLGPQQPIPPQA